jgi:hypothetical protein
MSSFAINVTMKLLPYIYLQDIKECPRCLVIIYCVVELGLYFVPAFLLMLGFYNEPRLADRRFAV